MIVLLTSATTLMAGFILGYVINRVNKINKLEKELDRIEREFLTQGRF